LVSQELYFSTSQFCLQTFSFLQFDFMINHTDLSSWKLDLLEALQQGYHYPVLFSSRMIYPAYHRLGSRGIAGKIGIYIFEKD
jgi:hypothetical protein